MSNAPWSNETERADYYQQQFKDQLAITERLEAEVEKLQKFKAYFDAHKTFDLEILGYTEDGDLTPFCNFYNDAIDAMNDVSK